MKTQDEWDELDGVAKVNLSPNDYELFIDYKARLMADGCTLESAKACLIGLIWDMTELYLHDE